ncbi:SDR family oxidoreductase, partial [Salmonella enterica subsp. enterica serovar Agona]|nr:SDR family oxidoreductase [Salmonella enterica subsp. enterica serovar Agona]
RLMANEWAKHNINVNAIAPGYMSTNNTQQLRADAQRSAEILDEIGADKIINLTPGQIYDAVTNQTQMPLKIKCQQGVAPRITFS